MGCPLCKDQPATSNLDFFMRKSSVRASRQTATLGTGDTLPAPQLRNAKLELQNTEEPPIYFLSGSPALRSMTPPKKAPRTSGWTDATLKAAHELQIEADPSRPPRRPPRRKKVAEKNSEKPEMTSEVPDESCDETQDISDSESDEQKPRLSTFKPPLPRSELKQVLKAEPAGKNITIQKSPLLSRYILGTKMSPGLAKPISGPNIEPSEKSPKILRSISGTSLQLPTSGLARSISGSNLQPPDSSPGLTRSVSGSSLPPDLILPEETAQQLEAYLRQNNSYSSLHILMNQLQEKALVSSSDDEDHFEALPAPPARKRRSADSPPNYPPPSPPRKDSPSPPPEVSWPPKRSPTFSRLAPLSMSHLASVEEHPSRPNTPGTWFDSGTNCFQVSSMAKRSYSPSHEITPQATPPPSEDEDDVPQEITHSVLLKILQQCSDDFGHTKLVSRRASVIPSHITLDGLQDFVKSLKPTTEEQETSSVSPSIGELESALADLLQEEKMNEIKSGHLELSPA